MGDEGVTRFTVSLPTETVAALEAARAATGQNRSEFVAEAVDLLCGREDRQVPAAVVERARALAVEARALVEGLERL